jgi:hypothetical protein
LRRSIPGFLNWSSSAAGHTVFSDTTPLAQAVSHEPLLTNDTDVAVPATLEVGEQELRDRLIRADFKERFLGDDQPPATHYELGEEAVLFMRSS